jgi:hypothetical protein
MLFYNEAALSKVSIHKLGNFSLGEPLLLSQKQFGLKDDLLKDILVKYFLSNFEKVNEVYRLSHVSGKLELNSIYHFVTEIFNDVNFHQNTKQIAKYLYEASAHPNIKSGELYISYFENVQFEGELLNAIGIFKSETKETYLKVKQEDKVLNVEYENEGINIKKLDKGCLVFNVEKKKGYKVLMLDNTNRSTEAIYWSSDFLNLKLRNDSFTQTSNVLNVYKNFVNEITDNYAQISKLDRIEMLNRSIKYFQEKNNFDFDEFTNTVIEIPEGIKAFQEYKTQYQDKYETQIDNSFLISEAALKKQSKIYKSIIKLDKNFHIYVHGERELIEKGFDQNRGLNYYKIFFKSEQ